MNDYPILLSHFRPLNLVRLSISSEVKARGCKKFCVNGPWQETAALHEAMLTVEQKPLPTDLIGALLSGGLQQA
jgi:hypothetical protein